MLPQSEARSNSWPRRPPHRRRKTADSPPVVEAPPLAPGAAPLCYVVDEEASIRHFLSLVLHGSGIDTMEFPDGAALRQAMKRRVPDLMFHNISLESADAIESVVALGKHGYRGAVQLMSNRGAAVLEHVKNIGIQHKLNMLPVLKKPFETDAIVKIIQELKLGMPAAAAARIELDEALDNNWIEFWYQPKIDLRKKQLAGAEAYARARHPQHGIVLPGAFMPGATEASVIKLSELALASALKAGADFFQARHQSAAHRQYSGRRAGQAADRGHREGASPECRQMAGPDHRRAARSRSSPTSRSPANSPSGWSRTMSGSRSTISAAATRRWRSSANCPLPSSSSTAHFVADCGTDKVNAPLCKTVIDLAHNFGRVAVAIGIEKAADAMALVSMGCDFGQGFLLGQPMPEERFISLLRQRAAQRKRQRPAGRPRGSSALSWPTRSIQWVQASRRLKAKLSE